MTSPTAALAALANGGSWRFSAIDRAIIRERIAKFCGFGRAS